MGEHRVCENCGLSHEPDDKTSCIEGHGDDEVQVTIHGKYERGPMPVEFRDALAEMVRLVKQAIDDGRDWLLDKPMRDF